LQRSVINNIKVTFLKTRNKKLSEFKKHEWTLIHPEHYGKEIDWKYWNFRSIRIKATAKGKVIAGLTGSIMAGVFHIEEFIIDHHMRGQGIGKDVLQWVEFYAKTEKVHMIYLETGENWEAVKFYEKLGFKKLTLINNFYEHKNFWIMTKYF